MQSNLKGILVSAAVVALFLLPPVVQTLATRESAEDAMRDSIERAARAGFVDGDLPTAYWLTVPVPWLPAGDR